VTDRRAASGRYGVIMVLIGALGFGWFAHFRVDAARDAYRAELARRRYPPLISGLRVPIGDASVSGNRQAPGSKHQLVMVFDDTCAFSRQEVPSWKTLLEQSPLTSLDISLVSLGGAEIAKELSAVLESRGVPYRLLRPADKFTFSARTGIVGLPQTLLLDPRDTVRLVGHRVDSRTAPRFLEELRSLVNGPS
jgi:hypothetical protein